MADRERRRIEERVSDPPEDETPRKLATGCTVAIVAAVLLVLAGGLLIGAWNRFAAPALRASSDDPDRSDPDLGDADPASDPAAVPSSDPLADMRRRYVPGPHVRIEGMIPAVDPLGSTSAPQAWARGRAGDTPWMVLGARY